MDDITILFLILGVLIVSLPFIMAYEGKKLINKMEGQIPDIRKALEDGSLESEAVAKAVDNFDEFKNSYKKYMIESLILVMSFFAFAFILILDGMTNDMLLYVMMALITILLVVFFLRNRTVIEVCNKFQNQK